MPIAPEPRKVPGILATAFPLDLVLHRVNRSLDPSGPGSDGPPRCGLVAIFPSGWLTSVHIYPLQTIKKWGNGSGQSAECILHGSTRLGFRPLDCFASVAFDSGLRPETLHSISARQMPSIRAVNVESVPTS